MESPHCADQRSDEDLVKSEAAAGHVEDKPFCNGRMTEDDLKIISNKKKSTLSDNENVNGGKRLSTKIEDGGKGEVPAHHARRPPNGFLLFCKRHRDIVSSKNPNLENRGVTKLLGNWWRTLEEDERDKYKELARQNKEIFIANNPQFTWYKLPAPPLRTLVTRPSNRRPPKLEPTPISGTGPITPGKLADESQLGGLTSLLSSSLSPPTTPLNSSPPLPTESGAPAPPKKRFLFQTRAQHSAEEAEYHSESDEAIDATEKKSFSKTKKKYKKKKNYNSIKYKKSLKLKWKGSLSGKMFLENMQDGAWKSNNNCTQQNLIEKIVDSSFDAQKPFQDYEIQRALDYINTEHTYQKNPRRFLQQQQQSVQKLPKNEKKNDSLPLHLTGKSEENDGNFISPNLNNNTIILSAVGPDKKCNFSYSFNDNNNLIINYNGSNQRKLDQLTILTNHDRMGTNDIEDGYIPGGDSVRIRETLEDCDTLIRSEDQKKPLKVAQVDRKHSEKLLKEKIEEEEKKEKEIKNEESDEGESKPLEQDESFNKMNEKNEHDFDEKNHGADLKEMPKSCDNINADFQSILGKVSREIVSMMKERDSQDEECMAVAKFNLRSRSETDSEDGSWYDKSDESLPESPEGRRSKRSCKGQRYEQFIKDSVSRKRSKNSSSYPGTGDFGKFENRNKRKKSEKTEVSEKRFQTSSVTLSEFLSKEREFTDKTAEVDVSFSSFAGRLSRTDLVVDPAAKASDIIQLKLDLERNAKKCVLDEKLGRKDKEGKKIPKKKPLSKVQMIKEKREIHVGEFNLNEKIEELPLLSFESFLQKKRQRKKRLLGLKKEGGRSKIIRNRLEKIQGKSLQKENPQFREQGGAYNTDPSLTASSFKPDFADLTTLAETALTLLSLREPR